MAAFVTCWSGCVRNPAGDWQIRDGRGGLAGNMDFSFAPAGGRPMPMQSVPPRRKS